MNGLPPNQNHKKMHKAVNVRQQRRKQWKKEGERSLWQNLSMVGALGWLIVVPTLLGVLTGRWLDNTFETGIFFTGSLIFLGILIGSYLAWQKVTKE